MPVGMTSPSSQSTAVENPSAERFGLGEEVQNPAGTGVGADYAAPFSVGENDWQRDTQNQNEWIPGFGKMVSNTTISDRRRRSTVSSGSSDATRRLESLSEDTQDHLRGHLNGRILSATTNAAT